MIIIFWPSCIKALLPYFSNIWPENSVMANCRSCKNTKAVNLSRKIYPKSENETLDPKTARAAPPES